MAENQYVEIPYDPELLDALRADEMSDSPAELLERLEEQLESGELEPHEVAAKFWDWSRVTSQ